MTNPNDNPRRDTTRAVDKDNTGMWIAGIVGLCLVLGLVFWAANRNTNTAMNDTRPNTTTSSTTTGSGVSPSTTAPKSQPAPAPSAPAAR